MRNIIPKRLDVGKFDSRHINTCIEKTVSVIRYRSWLQKILLISIINLRIYLLTSLFISDFFYFSIRIDE